MTVSDDDALRTIAAAVLLRNTDKRPLPEDGPQPPAPEPWNDDEAQP